MLDTAEPSIAALLGETPAVAEAAEPFLLRLEPAPPPLNVIEAGR